MGQERGTQDFKAWKHNFYLEYVDLGRAHMDAALDSHMHFQAFRLGETGF